MIQGGHRWRQRLHNSHGSPTLRPATTVVIQNGCKMSEKPAAVVWPRLLELPSDNVNIVYFDLNHWISLAQASVGHSKGTSFVKTLEACHAARSAGTAVFVLSSNHYVEMLKIKDPRQRREIADVMEELTDFATFVSRVVVMEVELAAMLDRFAIGPNLLPMIPLIGRGVRHSAGLLDRAGASAENVRAEFIPRKSCCFSREGLSWPL